MTLYLNKSVKNPDILEILPNSNVIKTSKVRDLGAVKKMIDRTPGLYCS